MVATIRVDSIDIIIKQTMGIYHDKVEKAKEQGIKTGFLVARGEVKALKPHQRQSR